MLLYRYALLAEARARDKENGGENEDEQPVQSAKKLLSDWFTPDLSGLSEVDDAVWGSEATY